MVKTEGRMAKYYTANWTVIPICPFIRNNPNELLYLEKLRCVKNLNEINTLSSIWALLNCL